MSKKCAACEAGSLAKKVQAIPYRRARRNQDGEVEPYGPVAYMNLPEEKAIKVREMMAKYNQSEVVMIDIDE